MVLKAERALVLNSGDDILLLAFALNVFLTFETRLLVRGAGKGGFPSEHNGEGTKCLQGPKARALGPCFPTAARSPAGPTLSVGPTGSCGALKSLMDPYGAQGP